MRAEHRQMLAALHQQVDQLKKKNKGKESQICREKKKQTYIHEESAASGFSSVVLPDLQFQLLMGGITSGSGVAPSEPEESGSGGSKNVAIGGTINVANGVGEVVGVIRGCSREEVDELESSAKALRAELHEAKSRNLYLTGLVEEQKR